MLHHKSQANRLGRFFMWWAVQDSNRAAARSAVSNQPSGLLLSTTGCGAQRLPRPLGGPCVLLAAGPTAPPCFCRRQQSSPLQFPIGRNAYRNALFIKQTKAGYHHGGGALPFAVCMANRDGLSVFGMVYDDASQVACIAVSSDGAIALHGKKYHMENAEQFMEQILEIVESAG